MVGGEGRRVPFFLADGGDPRDGGCEAFRPVSERGLRGGLFGETVFVLGGVVVYNLILYSLLLASLSFLSIALFPRRRVSSANPGRTALVVSLSLKSA